jgi:RNA-directed DNA polymerase
MQAIVKAALEPEWEARFEANSYGFRPGRCTMDAIESIFTTMSQKGSSQWVLDADISGCFDNIDQGQLLAKLPTFTTTLRRWLQAGVIEGGFFLPTAKGTPPGGVSSPLLANVALDGMERLFDAEYADGRPKAPAFRRGINKGIAVVRYGDDVVVTAPNREVLETYARPRSEQFLQERGLALSEAKTRTVHITEGVNFLRFTIRKFGKQGTLLTIPQKEKVLKHTRALRSYLDGHKQTPAVTVIRELNPIIRGWANYYRHSVARKTFEKVRHAHGQMLWRWARRRHPEKSSRWVKARYFKSEGYWTFHEKKAELVKPDKIPITRFVKVMGRSSPYDPALKEYWRKRRKRQVGWENHAKQRLILLQRQEYKCALCHIQFRPGEDIESDHIILKSQGGTNEVNNRRLVHPWCHRQRHQKDGRQRPRA